MRGIQRFAIRRASTSSGKFDWSDPFHLNSRLSEEEVMMIYALFAFHSLLTHSFLSSLRAPFVIKYARTARTSCSRACRRLIRKKLLTETLCTRWERWECSDRRYVVLRRSLSREERAEFFFEKSFRLRATDAQASITSRTACARARWNVWTVVTGAP